VTVPPPEARDARSSGSCWWSAVSWSSGTRQCWRSSPGSRWWTSRSGSGCPGRRCTGGRTATSPVAWRRWRTGRSDRGPRPGRCLRRWRRWCVRCAGLIHAGVHAGSAPSWPSVRSLPTARAGCRTARRSTGSWSASTCSRSSRGGGSAASTSAGSGTPRWNSGSWTSSAPASSPTGES